MDILISKVFVKIKVIIRLLLYLTKLNKLFYYWYKFCLNLFEKFNNGDWELGIGDWGLGIGPNPQSPIPKPKN